MRIAKNISRRKDNIILRFRSDSNTCGINRTFAGSDSRAEGPGPTGVLGEGY